LSQIPQRPDKKRRLQALLDMARQDQNGCASADAVRCLGVSERTLMRDVASLRKVGVDISISAGRIIWKCGDYQLHAAEWAMRRLAILSLLSEGPLPLEQIIDGVLSQSAEFGVDERTVRRDIRFLVLEGYIQQQGCAPGDSAVYGLTEAFMPRFTLPYSQLAAVMRALDTSPKALADPAAAESIRRKLMAGLTPDLTRVSLVSRRRHVVRRPRQNSSSLLSKVEVLELAACEQHTVEIVYRGLRSRGVKRPRVIEPLGVLYYSVHDMWYVVARCRTAQDVRLFRADRILSMAVTDERFEPPEGFKLDDYLEGQWGVYRGDPVSVRVRFYDEFNVISRVKAETAHRRRAVLRQVEPGVWEYTDTILGEPEFRAWLRSFGSSAEVIEPATMREELISSAKRMKQMYERQVDADEER
jgi:predicted DNA-binding transcriptional regulator YafY